MPLTMSCWNCSHLIVAAEGAATVVCPYCAQMVGVPSTIIAPSTLTSASRPVVERREPLAVHVRHETIEGSTRPWFGRGFHFTIGVIAALAVVFIGIPLVMVLGTGVVTANIEAANAAAEREAKAEALKCLKPFLERNGIVELAKDIDVRVGNGNTVLKGSGRDRDQRLHGVEALIETRQFDKYKVTELKVLLIDGIVCERAE